MKVQIFNIAGEKGYCIKYKFWFFPFWFVVNGYLEPILKWLIKVEAFFGIYKPKQLPSLTFKKGPILISIFGILIMLSGREKSNV